MSSIDSDVQWETKARPQLLIVDDQPLNIHLLNEIFKDDHDVFIATSGKQALEFCKARLPDLVLLDVIMPAMDGHDVCRKLKRDPLTKDIPVIFVTTLSDPKEEEEGLAAGAVDFIAKSASPQVMRARVKTHITLKRQADVLRSLVLTDALTGISNRRHLNTTLIAEWRRGVRQKNPLSLLMLDLDFFKHFNDHYGHQAGDLCLQRVAACIKASLSRSHDFVARYGGEEFICLLPDTPLAGGEATAAKLQQAVRGLAIPHEKTSVPGKLVTISLGVATAYPVKGTDPGQLILQADHLLYAAKQAGRDQFKSLQATPTA